jgi:hypothetical protein
MRGAFRWLSAILFVAVVVQIALAAFGAFDAVHKAEHVSISKKAIEDGFTAHAILGTLILVVMLVVLIVAAAGRLDSAVVGLAGAIFVLGIVQMLLGAVSTSAPVLGLLHGLNALAIFTLTGLQAHRGWPRGVDQRSAVDASAAVG